MTTEPNFDTLRERHTWTTREGMEIPVSEMSDDHLVNAIRYLRRNELQGLSDKEGAQLIPVFGAMFIEAEKRGLKP